MSQDGYHALVIRSSNKNMLTTIFEDKYMEGFAAGEAKRDAKSIAIVLKARFGKVPTRIVKSINSFSDPIVLESWLGFAATCKSLKEFE